MLWVVTFRGSYYDDDPRMPGSVPVEGSVYVLARGLAGALTKAEPLLSHLRKQCSASERGNPLEAHIVTIEALVAAAPIEQRPGISVFGHKDLKKITLNDPGDALRYRLAVCLVPVGPEGP